MTSPTNAYPSAQQVAWASELDRRGSHLVIVRFRARITGLSIKNQEIASNLNEATVALTAGNFDLASDRANRVLVARKMSKNSVLTAELLLIQAKARQGLFAGLLDQLELLFKKIPRSSAMLQARVGNEILRVCHRSGNLGIGAQRGEEMAREFSSIWPEVEVVELLCQLSSCHFHRGDTARAEEVVITALRIAEKSQSPKGKTQTLWQSSFLSINKGDLSLALQQIDEAKHWAGIAGMQHIIPILNNNAALIMLDLPGADLSQVHQLAESAYLQMSSQNYPGGTAYTCQILSEIALRQDDFKTALMYARKGMNELPQEIPGPKTALLVQIAKVLARMGNYGDAKSELAVATEHMEQQEPSRELAKQWGDIARVFVEVGQADRGVYAYEKAIQMSGLLREEQDVQVN